MFGFSLPKLLVLAAIIAAVWYGFKWISRYQQVQQSKGGKAGGRINATAEMTACPKCGTYVVADVARSCEREDCPYP